MSKVGLSSIIAWIVARAWVTGADVDLGVALGGVQFLAHIGHSGATEDEAADFTVVDVNT